jgi:hypothetical protein
MADEEQIYIEERADGKYAIRRSNSERASAVEERIPAQDARASL